MYFLALTKTPSICYATEWALAHNESGRDQFKRVFEKQNQLLMEEEWNYFLFFYRHILQTWLYCKHLIHHDRHTAPKDHTPWPEVPIGGHQLAIQLVLSNRLCQENPT
jgi:hypothetical protein